MARIAGAGQVVASGLATSVPEAAPTRPEPALPDVDYLAATEGYVAQNGHFPDAEQFGLFLAQYNVIDPSTRRPLPGTLLDPVLDELWTERHERFLRQDQAPVSGDGSSTETRPEGSNPGPEDRAEELPGGSPAGPAPGSTPARRHRRRVRRMTSWRSWNPGTERPGTLHSTTNVPIPVAFQ